VPVDMQNPADVVETWCADIQGEQAMLVVQADRRWEYNIERPCQIQGKPKHQAKGKPEERPV